MNLQEYMIEGIKETLDENGETLTDKCITDIADSVIIYYQNKELAFGVVESPVVRKDDVCKIEKNYQMKIAELKKLIDIYHNSVCRRHHVETNQVRIENDDVMIYK